MLGTLSWTFAFVRAIYLADHTRIQASKWIYQNVSAPIRITFDTSHNQLQQLFSAPDGFQITEGSPFIKPFTPATNGTLVDISTSHATVQPDEPNQGILRAIVALDPDGKQPVDEAFMRAENHGNGQTLRGTFHGTQILKDETYYLILFSTGPRMTTISRSIISNESWDEGLPLPIDEQDPFGQLYRGVVMEVRWYDDENKRQMFLEKLSQVDYVLLPSQRAVWSTSRIPLTYPMTMEYYQALFDGRLGFDLVATFTSPIQLGSIYISDVGGTMAWNKAPELPLFNYNLFAAEEAFSVYDHPPVWIFKKRDDFDIESARAILESIDLNNVIIQSPREATMATDR